MKKLFIAVLFIAVCNSTFAQSEKFAAAMQSKLAGFATAKTAEDFLDLSNAFERIAETEKTQWLAYYYAAQTQIIYGYMQKDMATVDPIADKAEQLINKADALEKNNSEISCIKSMVASLRMMVNPMQRFQQYGVLSGKLVEEAKTQDPTNPRPFALQSQTLFYTPAQFGGGCGVAKPFAEQGSKLLAEFKTKSPMHPNWGKREFEVVIGGCK